MKIVENYNWYYFILLLHLHNSTVLESFINFFTIMFINLLTIMSIAMLPFDVGSMGKNYHVKDLEKDTKLDVAIGFKEIFTTKYIHSGLK